jgi:ethanolamine ammonia-lyase small subunit
VTVRIEASQVRRIVEAVLKELSRADRAPEPTPDRAPEPSAGPASAGPASPGPASPGPASPGPASPTALVIDVPDPTIPAERRRIGVTDPANSSGLANLAGSTTARLAVGRAGPRPPTRAVLLFGADHAVTQDAIFGAVPEQVLDQFGLFSVQTQVTSRDEYLLRPDLGRLLSDDAKRTVAERCTKRPQVQIVVGDGLSAAAVTNNLPQIYPVIQQGLAGAGLTVGTPFFVRYCRVGVMNDINDVVQADVVVLLIGERPGLGVADALSVYSGWQPAAGKTDAHRDVICMITQNGGTNPLEAGAFAVEHVKNVIAHRASGVELRLAQSGSR